MTQTKHLTGLDPAGPGFTNQSCEVRFCKTDANFTEAVHTNGHPNIGFGTADEDGRNMPSWGEVWGKEVLMFV